MVEVIDFFELAFPKTVVSGNDFISQLNNNLKVLPRVPGVNAAQTELAIRGFVFRAEALWNEGVAKGFTTEENLQFVKDSMLTNTDALKDEFSGVEKFIRSSEKASLADFLGDVAETVGDIIPDIPNPFAALEWLQKNWLLIVIAIVVAIIIIIIVFSVMVTGPLMDAVMIGALS